MNKKLSVSTPYVQIYHDQEIGMRRPARKYVSTIKDKNTMLPFEC